MRSHSLPAIVCAAAITLASTAVSAGGAGVFFSTKTLLADFFKTSERVGFEKLPLDDGKSQVVYVAHTGEVVDGYAVVLNEIGQHEPITFGVLTDAEGRIRRVEVMAYREAYGHEIRSQRYLTQYVGRTSRELEKRRDVDAISGATISCRSAHAAVKRALLMVDRLRAQSAASTKQASTTTTTTTAAVTP